MPPRSFALAIPSLLAAALLTGCTTISPPLCPESGASHPPDKGSAGTASLGAKAPAKPAEQRRMYRLDFVVSSGDASKPGSSATYTMNLEEDHGGELHLGANIALQINAASPMSAPRQDVGLKIRCSYTVIGEDLVLQSSTEMSTADEAPTIRKMTVSGNAFVTPGKPTLVHSLEDPTSHKRFQMTVTATRLR